MQFTRLRLSGFKSFVDPTELVIAPGLTGVVGPNGCGKSNLLEALSWVMGENRPTAVRGEGMEDVIFAGSSARPARGTAEVALTLDNSERRAPAAFNGSDEIEVVRRITRDAGSVFRANGREARARDIQMLFADASTGAHSPALVRQGQIAELINARPRARRRILEEAAGISGLWQRRHEAELKLGQTELNLTRVQDVLDQLEQQLLSLARQARQAQRYREVSRELRRMEGIVLHLAWAAAEAEQRRAEEAAGAALLGVAAAEGEASARARGRRAAEAALPPLREAEAVAAAALQRLAIERERLAEEETRRAAEAAEAAARLLQLGRDREREAALLADAAATLDRLAGAAAMLAAAAADHPARQEAAAAAAREAEVVLAAAEAELARRARETARLQARHQAAGRRAEAAARAEAEARRDRDAAIAAQAEAERAAAGAAGRRQAAGAAVAAAQAAAETAEGARLAAEAARAAAEAREAEARAAAGEADVAARALAAELAGIDRLLATRAGPEGQIIDRVRAAPGWEAALGAALGEDLARPEAADPGQSGWAALPAYEAVPPLPPGTAPLGPQVTAPPHLARRLALTGVVAAAAGPALQPALLPGQRLVSREGDLWRWDGLTIAAGEAESAAANRLRLRNRQEALAADLAAASERAGAARAAHRAAQAARDRAATEDQAARAAARAAEQALTEAGRTRSRAEAEAELLAGRLAAARQALARRDEALAAATAELAAAAAETATLEDIGATAAAEAEARGTAEAARHAALAARAALDDIRREGEAQERRQREIAGERRTWEDRRAAAEARVTDLAARAAEAEAARTAAEARGPGIAARRAGLADALAAAEERRKRAADALALGETALRAAIEAEREAERAASQAREARARAGALAEAAAERAAAVAARIAEEMGAAPADLPALLDLDPAALPSRELAEMELQRLRRAREALGAVNLRAEEDRAAVAAERDTLAGEKADLEQAIAKLRLGIAELNREGRQRLVAAFEGVNRNFATLFRHLFGGGEANLVLVESEDPLDAGLEIMCMPPGKKLSTLSLLSGGEQTLTALSLIFAVFLANPAPICVLDEVDAPLDDANVTRFCDLLDEMARRTRTRFLVITHHPVTMARMDRLFGVTMAERGVSQLVSVDLKRAEELTEG
jgi:chromosome segregation protein